MLLKFWLICLFNLPKIYMAFQWTGMWLGQKDHFWNRGLRSKLGSIGQLHSIDNYWTARKEVCGHSLSPVGCRWRIPDFQISFSVYLPIKRKIENFWWPVRILVEFYGKLRCISFRGIFTCSFLTDWLILILHSVLISQKKAMYCARQSMCINHGSWDHYCTEICEPSSVSRTLWTGLTSPSKGDQLRIPGNFLNKVDWSVQFCVQF